MGLEVVDDSADGLNVGVLGLPLVMAAVVSALHNVHSTTEVWLLVHHPAGGEGKRRVLNMGRHSVCRGKYHLIKENYLLSQPI